MAGARWVQSEILEKEPSRSLKVYAVWFDVLPSDDRSRWPEGLFRDARVVQIWDELRLLGRRFAAHPGFRDRGLIGGEVMWDTYLLFGPEARWQEGPSHLASAGYTIVGARERLSEALRALLAPEPARSD